MYWLYFPYCKCVCVEEDLNDWQLTLCRLFLHEKAHVSSFGVVFPFFFFIWTKRRSGADTWVFFIQQPFTEIWKRLGVIFSAFVFLCACEIIQKGSQRLWRKNAAVVVGEHPKTMVHCAGCERPILDRFLLNVLDRAWHIKCVQCCECKCNLTEKCFSREGKLYCKNDFFR